MLIARDNSLTFNSLKTNTMKNIFIPIFLAASLMSCNDSVDIKTEFETPNKTDEISSESVVKAPSNLNAFEENLSAFENCKVNKKSNTECKEFIAKSICEYYGIDDLKEGTNYVDYDKIPQKLKELDSWKELGDFTEENIQIALKQLNNFEKPVLVFNQDDKYVHVVALNPNGKVFKSRKWGDISVPSCISYFPKRKDSFTSKGINYAFSEQKNLVIWIRN